MFQTVEPLSAERHGSLRYRSLPDYSFAAGLTSAPITYSEMLEASKCYPIVFPAEGTPVVLLGVEGANHFVDDEGSWKAPYVPGHVMRYPFILGQTDQPGQMVVMVDVDAPHFQTDQGERLFDDAGAQTPVVERVKNFLGSFEEEGGRSKQLTARLFEAEVLIERSLQKNRNEQSSTVFRQIYVVDEEKLLALPDDKVLGWFRDGTLALVYAHLISLANLKRLGS